MFPGVKAKRAGALLALVRGIATYAVTLCALSAASFVEVKLGFTSPASIFLPYLAAGLFLNHAVLRNVVEWHPVWNTLDNVAGVKIKMFLFWPIAYPLLFLRLLAVAVL